jgi:hypothetical protein
MQIATRLHSRLHRLRRTLLLMQTPTHRPQLIGRPASLPLLAMSHFNKILRGARTLPLPLPHR